MKNKMLKLYIQNNKNKNQILKIKPNQINKILKEIKQKNYNTENYNKYWNYGNWIKKSSNIISKKRNLKSINRYQLKEPMFLKTEKHITRYKHLLDQFDTKNIYDYRIADYNSIFSLNTTSRINAISKYYRYNNKKLNFNYTIYIIGGRKIVGELKIIFVESNRARKKVKCYFNGNKDITVNSVFIASETKIIGYTKYEFRSINFILRASHPIDDICKLEMLSALQENNNYKQKTVNDYIKFTYKTRLLRYEEFTQGIFDHVENELLGSRKRSSNLLSEFNIFKEKNYKRALNVSLNFDHYHIFIMKQLYRFVMHMYWKYVTSELNIFMLQAHVRERNFAYKLKTLHAQSFKSTNKHIKDSLILLQLQPKTLKIFQTKTQFEEVIWSHKNTLASLVLNQYSWVRSHVGMLYTFKTTKTNQQYCDFYFGDVKSVFNNFEILSDVFDRNKHSKEVYFWYLWTQDSIKLLTNKLTLQDVLEIKKLKQKTNHNVPTSLEAWEHKTAQNLKSLTLKDVRKSIKFLKNKIIKQHALLAKAYNKLNLLNKRNKWFSMNLEKRLKYSDNVNTESVKAAIDELEKFATNVRLYARELSDKDGCRLAVIYQRRIKSLDQSIPLPKSFSTSTDLTILLKSTKRATIRKFKASKKKHRIFNNRRIRKRKATCPLVRLEAEVKSDAFVYVLQTKINRLMVRIKRWKRLKRGNKESRNVRRKRIKDWKIDKEVKLKISKKLEKIRKLKRKLLKSTKPYLVATSYKSTAWRKFSKKLRTLKFIIASKPKSAPETKKYIEVIGRMKYLDKKSYNLLPFINQHKYDIMCLRKNITIRKQSIRKILRMARILQKILKHRKAAFRFNRAEYYLQNPKFKFFRKLAKKLVTMFYIESAKLHLSYLRIQKKGIDLERELVVLKNPKACLKQISNWKLKLEPIKESINRIKPLIRRVENDVRDSISKIKLLQKYEMHLLQNKPIDDKNLKISTKWLDRLIVLGRKENIKIYKKNWLLRMVRHAGKDSILFSYLKTRKHGVSYVNFEKYVKNYYKNEYLKQLAPHHILEYYQTLLQNFVAKTHFKTTKFSNFENLWVLNSLKYVQKLKTLNNIDLYRPHILHNKKTKNKNVSKDDDDREVFNELYRSKYGNIRESNADIFFYKTHFEQKKSIISYNTSTPFVPKTSIDVFFKKLIKNKHFDIKHVSSPTFLKTPYVGIDYTPGLDLKFYKNPNKYLKKYINKQYVSKKYIQSDNYIYEPQDLTNLKVVSMCFSALHEKTNLDENYISDLFTNVQKPRFTKEFTKEFRKEFYKKKSKKSANSLPLPRYVTNRSVGNNNYTKQQLPVKRRMLMIYSPWKLKSLTSRNKLNIKKRYNLSLVNIVSIKDIKTKSLRVQNLLNREDYRLEKIKQHQSRRPYPLRSRFSYNKYTTWHNKNWALRQMLKLTKKLPKKILLNILGFDQLINKGVDHEILKNLINELFIDQTKNGLNHRFLKNYFDLTDKNIKSNDSELTLIQEKASKQPEYLFARVTENSYRWKEPTFELYIFRYIFNQNLLGGLHNFYNTFDKFFYSKLTFTLYKWRRAGIKRTELWSRYKIQIANFNVWPYRLKRYNRRLYPKRLQKKSIKFMTRVYSMCTLYAPFARHFVPVYTNEGLHPCSRELIKEQPKLLTKRKPLTFKLLFNFKKHYLFITLLDKKNNILFSLHAGLFIRFFNYKKSLKKSKSTKIILIRYLRKLLMLSNLNNFILYVKQTSDQLNKLLQILQKPINHSFTDPITGQVITEEMSSKKKRKQLFNFLYIIFLKNKPYGVMKTKKTGRLKRKIRRLVIRANRIID